MAGHHLWRGNPRGWWIALAASLLRVAEGTVWGLLDPAQLTLLAAAVALWYHGMILMVLASWRIREPLFPDSESPLRWLSELSAVLRGAGLGCAIAFVVNPLVGTVAGVGWTSLRIFSKRKSNFQR